MTAADRITVVVTTYNRASIMRRSLESVLTQGRPADEIVVVDDGSTDETRAVVQDAGQGAVRYVHQENRGLSAARNRGVEEATGDWVVFLDDDDAAEPGWLDALSRQMGPDVGVVCCGARYVTPDGEPLRERMPGPLGPVFGNAAGLFLAGTFAVRRALLLETGGYADGLTCSHQTELSLRLLPACRSRGERVATVSEALVRIEERPMTDRPMSSPAALLAGSTYVIDHHESALRADPRYYADFCSVAGVSAARLAHHRSAIHWLARAARTDPSLTRLARLVLAAVPPLGARVWKTRDFSTP